MSGELVALPPQSAAGNYTVLSRAVVPEPGPLRAAGASYETDIKSLYLQLPDTLEPRLAELAARWTAGSATPYDAAVAIERRLRELPYSLDLPTPPADRELVSWFLFQERLGLQRYAGAALMIVGLWLLLR